MRRDISLGVRAKQIEMCGLFLPVCTPQVGTSARATARRNLALVMTSDDKTILTSAAVVITLMFGVLILG